MKLFEFAPAPNPRRVRIFAAEKGMVLDTVQVDIRAGEQFGDSFRALNSYCTVPALVLDDGSCISESLAICRYLEALKPDPPPMGTDAKDHGQVDDNDCGVDHDWSGSPGCARPCYGRPPLSGCSPPCHSMCKPQV